MVDLIDAYIGLMKDVMKIKKVRTTDGVSRLTYLCCKPNVSVNCKLLKADGDDQIA